LNITNYSKSGIEKIKSVSILEDVDLNKISDLATELQRVFEVHQVFRTETEMRYSVLSHIKFPTPASKYWQSIREQNVFFTNLIYISCEYEEKQGELEILEIDLEEIDISTKRGKANEKIKKAQIKKAQFNLMSMRIIARDQVREIRIWEQIKNELRTQADFDTNDVNTNQLESLQKRWEGELELSKLSNHKELGRNSISGLATIANGKKTSGFSNNSLYDTISE
jgi:hypothetical protein